MKKSRKRDGSQYKRLPVKGARSELLAAMRPTTLMDFAYELRRRTNYESVDEYGSDASDVDVRRSHDGLLYLARSGMLHYELRLAQYVGLDALRTAAEQWTTSVRRVGRWAAEPLAGRLDAIGSALSAS